MRISDWSSDVCSSDLPTASELSPVAFGAAKPPVLLLSTGIAPTAALSWPRLTASAAAVPSATLTIRRWLVVVPTETVRSEEHTAELQSLMRNSYAVFCLEKTTTRSHGHGPAQQFH